MSDLISRSALLKAFAEKTPFGCGTIGIKFVDDLIKAQPTAFDKEKVVAELEDERKFWEDAYDYQIGKEKARSYSRAIDIVRKGGIE